MIILLGACLLNGWRYLDESFTIMFDLMRSIYVLHLSDMYTIRMETQASTVSFSLKIQTSRGSSNTVLSQVIY
jgi:hypothetical protein